MEKEETEKPKVEASKLKRDVELTPSKLNEKDRGPRRKGMAHQRQSELDSMLSQVFEAESK